MKGKRRAVAVCIAVAVLCAGFVGALVWYKSPRPIPVPGAEGVLSVNIMVVEGARDEDFAPTLTPEQAQQIVECLGRYSMSRGSEKKYSMHIEEPYYYITVWLRNEDGEKYNVNVSNVAHHSTVQFGEKHHDILDSASLLAQLREIVPWEETPPEEETPETDPQEGDVLFDNGEVTYYADFDDGFVIDGYDADYLAYHGYLYLAGARFLGEELAQGEGSAHWGNEEKTALDFGWRGYYPLEEERARELALAGTPEINWSFQIDLERGTVSGRDRGASEYAETDGKASPDDLTDEALVEIGKKLAQILSDADEFREH